MSDPGRRLARRLRAHGAAKLGLGALLTAVFCAGYFAIEYHPLRPPIHLRPARIDQAVPFRPGWVWIYQSLYLLLALGWLAETRDQLRRYVTGFTLLMAAGFTCFLLWPVAGPRPQEITADPLYNLVVRYDTPLNSFPSLHMALAAYSAGVAAAVTSGSRSLRRRLLTALLPAWIVLIGYATLATKQHYWIDLPPGIALGWLAQKVAWWRAAPRATRASTLKETA
jgi:membrane-associated phospholipid phosphatase